MKLKWKWKWKSKWEEEDVEKNEKWVEREKKSRKTLAFITLSTGLYRKRNLPSWSYIFILWFFLSVHSFTLFLYFFPFYLVSILFVMLLSQFDIFTLSAHWILLHRIGNVFTSFGGYLFSLMSFDCAFTRACAHTPLHSTLIFIFLIFWWSFCDAYTNWIDFKNSSKNFLSVFHFSNAKIEWCRKQ